MSGNRSALDCVALSAALPHLEGVTKGPLHVAIAEERASNEQATKFSKFVRRCMLKFKQPFDDGKLLHRVVGKRNDLSQTG